MPSRPPRFAVPTRALRIAVIGSGISGMAAAWLLSHRHSVVLFEKAARLGGHSNTVSVPTPSGPIPVDTGFIVYNEPTYPNLAALFAHLGVASQASSMSFAVSLDKGRFEYNGTDLKGLFGQPANALRPRFWSMLQGILRFYRDASRAKALPASLTLGAFLERGRYGRAFRDDHLLPMAAAIWSAPAGTLLDYPAEAFIRFCDNHGLLKIAGRPEWRTVSGGSRAYVERLIRPYAEALRLGCDVRAIRRQAGGVRIVTAQGEEVFDHVVIATHANQALALLEDADETERAVLGAFRYSRNLAVLHSNPALMPRRPPLWASWNYLGSSATQEVCVTYWMNRLQSLDMARPLFVTLNPPAGADLSSEAHREVYHHPIFDAPALAAQRELWSLQGAHRTWFCGAYFGSGFHEDGLQAGLAVAEALGGVRRPWQVAQEATRIALPDAEQWDWAA